MGVKSQVIHLSSSVLSQITYPLGADVSGIQKVILLIARTRTAIGKTNTVHTENHSRTELKTNTIILSGIKFNKSDKLQLLPGADGYCYIIPTVTKGDSPYTDHRPSYP